MKILLVGEYSRLHNSLKEGLLALNHEVTILGSGDGFKKFPVDITLDHNLKSGLKKKLRVLIYNILKKDIATFFLRKRFYKLRKQLVGYDVVQLINESPFKTSPALEIEFIQFLQQHNKKLFLLSCGTDHISVSHAFEKKFRYSILTPLFENKVTKAAMSPALKYISKSYKNLHHKVVELCNGIISSDMDYHIPLLGHDKYLGLIPNPINTDLLRFNRLTLDGKLIIFHGINCSNYYKKGNDLFEAALAIIKSKYEDTVEIITVRSLPYDEYIKQYNKAHILLDQVYSYDQGYNALEAMAKGKVVFTGAEKEFENFYKLTNQVAVNVLPDVNDIVTKLEDLITNPDKLISISNQARSFIEKEHHYITIAKQYCNTWEKH